MTDAERALLDAALSVLERRIYEGDAEGRAALRHLARAALARAEGDEPRREHLVTVVQRLVGAVGNLRARFPGGEPATPIEEALDVVELTIVELERLVRWPGRAAPAPDARPEGDQPTCRHCGAPCVDTAPGSIDPQYGYEFDPSAVSCPRPHLPDEPSEAGTTAALLAAGVDDPVRAEVERLREMRRAYLVAERAQRQVVRIVKRAEREAR